MILFITLGVGVIVTVDFYEDAIEGVVLMDMSVLTNELECWIDDIECYWWV